MSTVTSSYTATLTTLYNLSSKQGMDLSLDRCQKLHQLLEEPATAYPTVHIAGTNGKGSVAHKVSRVLTASGYRVGLFTSPHVACLRERIQINGELISEAALVEGVQCILQKAKEADIPLTFFEVITLLAFRYFKEEKVDCAVIEVGLGGRLDATNIMTPLLSIITSIGIDHTQYLGKTLEAIAREKAGIIKAEVPVLIGPSVPLSVVLEKKNAGCQQLKERFETAEEENQALAEAALPYLEGNFPLLRQLAVNKRTEALQSRPPCRFQQVQAEGYPPIVLDVAHNAPALKNLFEKVNKEYPGAPIFALTALSKDKEIQDCLDQFKNTVYFSCFVEAPNGRSTPSRELKECLGDDCTSRKTPLEGLSFLKKACLEVEGVIVVCGSFFIMAPLFPALGIKMPCDPFDSNEVSLQSRAV